ncbi:DUF4249 family protein [Aquimarina litoralis]|uniref:DUF4249 family protein n=1 Tax=Aquimarina litoralis TaxID=584605 RepID=UPI001C55CC5D|nr:DUF4249 family protein [Aquimarina litoralis]MBW1295463.1 DUF4249 family protein [Aquimarina litoralis]
MKKLHIYITLIGLFTLIGCVEDINPNFEFEEQVFISGLMTHEDGFVSIQVQKTVSVTDTTFSAVNDAQVSLFTKDASNTVSLVSNSFDIENGTYTTSEMITPIIGNIYWIEVMLQDETVFISEEEVLTPPIPIMDMVKNGNTVTLSITGPLDEQNFYLFRIEIIRDGILFSDEIGVGLDRIINENEEKFLTIGDINDGDTVKASLYNINYSTFQFYSNVVSNLGNEPEVSALFLPINLIGNIKNITTNEVALGNFGVAGFSVMTQDF